MSVPIETVDLLATAAVALGVVGSEAEAEDFGAHLVCWAGAGTYRLTRRPTEDLIRVHAEAHHYYWHLRPAADFEDSKTAALLTDIEIAVQDRLGLELDEVAERPGWFEWAPWDECASAH